MDLYHALLAPIAIPFGPQLIGKAFDPTSWMELLAVLFTALSIFGATRLKIAQYPVGIVGTILYSFVFIDAKLFSSLALNVYFTVIQLYGMWYWMYGGKTNTHLSNGLTLKIPPIGDWSWKVVGIWAVAATAISALTGYLVAKYLNGSSAFLDAGILSASVLAQFLLDRKQLKSWIIWMIVDVLSIIVYGVQQHLVVSGVLYVAALLNAFYGYFHWKNQMAKTPSPGGIEVWEKGTRV